MARLAERLRGLRVVHPFPSGLNALLVLVLGLLAGGSLLTASALAVAMLLLQFSIGAANDVSDEDLDRLTKPNKPIPAGLIARRTAVAIAVVSGLTSLLMAAAFGPPELVMAGMMLGAGMVYNYALKRTAWGWLAFSVAFPLLPLYAWYGASGLVPPYYELVLPLAVLAGPAIQLSNGLVDVERDSGGGVRTLAGRLGRRRAQWVIAVLLLAIHTTAWLTLVAGGASGGLVVAALAVAGALSAGGLYLSAQADVARRERGWQAQACAVALLAVAWTAAVFG